MNATRILASKQYSEIDYQYKKHARAWVLETSRGMKVRIPPSPTSSLGITSRYLVLQVRVKPEQTFTFTIQLRDDRGNTFNCAYTTIKTKASDRPTSSSHTSALINLDIPAHIWVAAFFDLQEIANRHWRPGAFQALHSLEIAHCATVNKIYAQDSPPVFDDQRRVKIPKGCEFPPGLEFQTVVFPTIEDGESNASAFAAPAAVTASVSAKRSVKTVPARRIGPRPVPKEDGRTARPAGAPKRAAKAKEVAPPPRAEEEDSLSDNGAFDGRPPSANDEKQQGPPGDELELVYLPRLNCYYCPGNEQYYQLDGQ
jgi:hypothetical protein